MRSGGVPFDESAAHRLPDRDDALGALQVEAHEQPQDADQRTALQPAQLDGDLGEDVL